MDFDYSSGYGFGVSLSAFHSSLKTQIGFFVTKEKVK